MEPFCVVVASLTLVHVSMQQSNTSHSPVRSVAICLAQLCIPSEAQPSESVAVGRTLQPLMWSSCCEGWQFAVESTDSARTSVHATACSIAHLEVCKKPCVRLCVLQTALAQRNQELQVMVDQAASRPQSGHADATAPFMRVDLREETVTEKAQPGGFLLLLSMACQRPFPKYCRVCALCCVIVV